MYSPKYPPTTTEPQLDNLLTAFKDWSLAHGLTVRPPPAFSENPHSALATHAPVSLFPSLFPRSSFNEARAVQTAYNELYARVSDDSEFLDALTDDIAQVDDFIANLHAIQKQIAATEGFAHEFSLGLFRSDYMLHDSGDSSTAPIVQQVEFNTIASSFGGLASRVSELHRFLVKSGAYPEDPNLTLENVPVNPAADGLASGLASAHEAYGSPAEGHGKAVLFIVQPGERNVFDQYWLSYALLEKHGVRSYRATLAEVPDLCKVDETKNRRLFYKPEFLSQPIEISTVYFRAGYSPDDYPTEREWEARHLLERSRAIKCPTVATQLAGAKKVQQVLAVDGMLERFLDASETIKAIRSTFAGIHPLDTTPLGLAARKLAFEHPERYVLKPQREGGGNNVYRENIPIFLREIGEDKWSGYILMELIKTPITQGVIVRNGESIHGWVVGELGVYGVALWDRKGKMARNDEVGWLLRTKGRESDEGGVAAGFGCVDGVCLVD